MKFFLILLSLAAVLRFANAQTATVSGQITDEQHQPLAYANVLLHRAADSTLLSGTVTDDTGNYQLSVPDTGRYFLVASLIGYQNKHSGLIDMDTVREIGLIQHFTLATDALLLEGIEVTARRPLFEQRFDRMVVNVENSITNAGGNALEILSKTPGVTVDRGLNTISLMGKQGIIVMVNDKRSRMDRASLLQWLAGIPADNISRIELIMTPPAEYDAEGDAGIIHIVLRQSEEQGLNGSYSLSTSYGQRPKVGGSSHFNWRTAKWNLYTSLAANTNWTQQDFAYTRRFTHAGESFFTDGYSQRPATISLIDFRLGADFTGSENTSFGWLFSGYRTGWLLDARTRTTTTRNEASQLDEHLISRESNTWWHGLGNLFFRHRFADQSEVEINMDYLYYQDDNPTDYELVRTTLPTGNPDGQQFRSEKYTPIHFQVLKLDYRRSLTSEINLESGLKGTRSTFVNDIGVQRLQGDSWQSDPFFTARYQLREYIGAAYTSIQYQINDRMNVKAGLRYELIDTNLGTREETDIVDRTYARFFPSLFFEHKFTENQQLHFSYGRRITRPSYNDMAPAFFFWGPNTIVTGNPAVQPTLSDQWRLGYRWKTLLFNIQYSYDDQPITWGLEIDPAINQQVNRVVNMRDRHLLGSTLNIPWSPTPWWESQQHASVFWQQQRPIDQGEILKRRDWYYQFSSTQRFRLPTELDLEVSYRYRSRTAYGLATITARQSIDLGLQKTFGAWKWSLNWSDVFKTGNFFELLYDIPQTDLFSTWHYSLEGSVVRLSVRRSFGGESKNKERQQTASEEERGRVN